MHAAQPEMISPSRAAVRDANGAAGDGCGPAELRRARGVIATGPCAKLLAMQVISSHPAKCFSCKILSRFLKVPAPMGQSVNANSLA